MSDNANEALQETSPCTPNHETTFRKYACYQPSGSSDWFTHTIHPDAAVWAQSGCMVIVPAIPPLLPAVYAPQARAAHPKDYVSGGRMRYYMGTGAQPTGYIRVSRND